MCSAQDLCVSQVVLRPVLAATDEREGSERGRQLSSLQWSLQWHAMTGVDSRLQQPGWHTCCSQAATMRWLLQNPAAVACHALYAGETGGGRLDL